MSETYQLWGGRIRIENMTDEHLDNARTRYDERLAETPLKDEDTRLDLQHWKRVLSREITRRDQELDELENV